MAEPTEDQPSKVPTERGDDAEDVEGHMPTSKQPAAQPAQKQPAAQPAQKQPAQRGDEDDVEGHELTS